MKSAVIFSLIIVAGLPLNEPLFALIVLFSGVAIFYGELRQPRLVFIRVGGILLLALLIHSFFPRAAVEEGHNIFIIKEGSNGLSLDLPKNVFGQMESDFNKAYPPESRCDSRQYGCWRYHGLPVTTYAFSPNGLWRQAEMSAVISHIDVDGAKSVGPTFINDIRYNWYEWVSDIKRETPPFFVAYKIPRELVGSSICWKGSVIWNQQKYFHENISCRAIVDVDVGQKVYGYSFSNAPLMMQLDKSQMLKSLDIFYDVLRIFLILAVVVSSVKIRFSRLIYPFFCLSGMLFLMWGMVIGTPVLAGGDDGLTHHGYSAEMMKLFLSGNWMEALMGLEATFYFMPGLRYVLLLEQAIFGEKFYLTVLVVAFLPIALGRVIAMVTSPKIGQLAGILFVMFGFIKYRWISSGIGMQPMDYIYWAERGFAEPFAYLVFLIAFGNILMLIPNEAPLENRKNLSTRIHSPHDMINKSFGHCIDLLWLGVGILLALATFLRPNLAFGVAILLAYIAYILAKAGSFKNIIILAFGFSFLCLVPIHNIYYGNQFVIFTTASAIKENLPMPPYQYLNFLLGDGVANTQVSAHLYRWLRDVNGVEQDLIMPLRIILLSFLSGALILGGRKVKLCAFVALGLQLPLLFYTPVGRYALLAWLFSFIAVLGFVLTYKKRKLKTIPD